MKKSKKLNLSTETIRSLAPLDLTRAGGGAGTYPVCPRTYYLCGDSMDPGCRSV